MTFYSLIAVMKDENALVSREKWSGSHLYIYWNKERKRFEWNNGIEWEANAAELNAGDWRRLK